MALTPPIKRKAPYASTNRSQNSSERTHSTSEVLLSVFETFANIHLVATIPRVANALSFLRTSIFPVLREEYHNMTTSAQAVNNFPDHNFDELFEHCELFITASFCIGLMRLHAVALHRQSRQQQQQQQPHQHQQQPQQQQQQFHPFGIQSHNNTSQSSTHHSFDSNQNSIVLETATQSASTPFSHGVPRLSQFLSTTDAWPDVCEKMCSLTFPAGTSYYLPQPSPFALARSFLADLDKSLYRNPSLSSIALNDEFVSFLHRSKQPFSSWIPLSDIITSPSNQYTLVTPDYDNIRLLLQSTQQCQSDLASRLRFSTVLPLSKMIPTLSSKSYRFANATNQHSTTAIALSPLAPFYHNNNNSNPSSLNNISLSSEQQQQQQQQQPIHDITAPYSLNAHVRSILEAMHPIVLQYAHSLPRSIDNNSSSAFNLTISRNVWDVQTTQPLYAFDCQALIPVVWLVAIIDEICLQIDSANAAPTSPTPTSNPPSAFFAQFQRPTNQDSYPTESTGPLSDEPPSFYVPTSLLSIANCQSLFVRFILPFTAQRWGGEEDHHRKFANQFCFFFPHLLPSPYQVIHLINHATSLCSALTTIALQRATQITQAEMAQFMSMFQHQLALGPAATPPINQPTPLIQLPRISSLLLSFAQTITRFPIFIPPAHRDGNPSPNGFLAIPTASLLSDCSQCVSGDIIQHNPMQEHFSRHAARFSDPSARFPAQFRFVTSLDEFLFVLANDVYAMPAFDYSVIDRHMSPSIGHRDDMQDTDQSSDTMSTYTRQDIQAGLAASGFHDIFGSSFFWHSFQPSVSPSGANTSMGLLAMGGANFASNSANLRYRLMDPNKQQGVRQQVLSDYSHSNNNNTSR